MHKKHIIAILGIIAIILMFTRPFSRFHIVSHAAGIEDRDYTQNEVISEKRESFYSGMNMIDGGVHMIMILPSILIIVMIILAYRSDSKKEDA